MGWDRTRHRTASYPEIVMSSGFCRPRLVNARRMKSDFCRFDQSYLFESVVDDFQLLYGQVSVYFNDNALDSDTSGRAAWHVYQGSSFSSLRIGTICWCCYSDSDRRIAFLKDSCGAWSGEQNSHKESNIIFLIWSASTPRNTRTTCFLGTILAGRFRSAAFARLIVRS